MTENRLGIIVIEAAIAVHRELSDRGLNADRQVPGLKEFPLSASAGERGRSSSKWL